MTSSFTRYDGCLRDSVACGSFDSGYNAAVSENRYGQANGHSGLLCGTCWNLTATTDMNGQPFPSAQWVVVKVNDLCPNKLNEQFCEPVGSQALNGMGMEAHFDLCGDTSPLLRLPAEIRTIIYHLLLAPEKNGIIRIRTESPMLHKARNAMSMRRRSRFRVVSDRVRSGSSETSYTGHRTSDIDTAILGVCRQIHTEACHVLYSEHTFDFDIDVESIVPFFRDLTPAALASVESIRFVKRALPYCKDFDRCEWRSACAFLATQMKLRRVILTVVGGRPGPVWGAPVGEWESQGPWKIEDFYHIMQSERMEWARQVTSIRGLRALVVVSALEHCPPPRSKDMVFFANFTANLYLTLLCALLEILQRNAKSLPDVLAEALRLPVERE
ncbi:MAG: hypothetical protein L6R40_003828 [Gallowayella cf. fulva]|nr:MAG: hypothetical protein L6R40_003828 [Xanthomendoza cf. fulva]